MPTSSKIFKGYRALGFVSNHVPLLVRYIHKRKENLIITCVGKSFHTYGCNKLSLLSVSEPHEADIEVMAADRALVYTAVGTTVRAWRRGTELVHKYPDHKQPVHLMLPFGPHLITVDTDSTLRMWDINSEELYTELSFSNDTFRVTCLLHPSTYLNKVLLGSAQGGLQLWNLRTSNRVHTFSGWGAAVTALEQAPAVDVAAIGLASGEMLLHNLRYDETLMRFQQEWGPVTSLAFRTDGPPVMMSGSTQGHVALWDLEERKLLSQMWEAHNGSVTGMVALPSEPLLVTSSPDNTLKVWIFDMPDGGGRLLRLRGGHSAPPSLVRFYGAHGNILSAGLDSTVRVFSSENDAVSRSFGQASYNRKLSKKRRAGAHDTLKMPPAVALAAEPIREKEWDNIVAVHRGVTQVTTWSYDKQRMGDHRLVPARFEKQRGARAASATCVDITACGNFALVGYDTGHVDRFNLQSGLARGSYGDPAHEGGVRGVASSGLVHQVLTAGADGRLRFWRLKTGQPLHALQLDAPPAKMVLHRESALCALALDDFSACVVDADGRRVVRRFAGHAGPLTDLCISPDANWLLTAGMDCCVRVWSLPQAALVDVLRTAAAPTSVSLGPAGRLLATSHVDEPAVYLWANRTLFDLVGLPPLPADHLPAVAAAPGSAPDDGVVRTAADEQPEVPEMKEEEDEEAMDGRQLADRLVTLSLLPESRWAHLLNVDAIRKRNKPKEPPKVPKAAPFFLPTTGGPEPKFDLSDPAIDGADDSARILHLGALSPITELGRLLLKAETGEQQHYAAVMDLLKGLGPWQLDSELRQLAPAPGGSTKLLRLFLTTLHSQLDTGRDFELAQAYLGLFLKLHGPAISESGELRALVDKVGVAQVEAWHRLQDRINSTLCLVSFLRSSTIG